MIDLEKKRTDIACDLFRAISALLPLQLHKDDLSYLIMQLVIHYVHYLQYFECIAQKQFSRANLFSTKSMSAKNAVIAYLEHRYTQTCASVLNDVFGSGKWSHVINDGTISYV